MSRRRKLRLVLSMTLIWCLVFSLAAPVFAEEGDTAAPETTSAAVQTSPDGVYAVVGTSSGGKQVSTNVVVTTIGDRVQFQARVLGVPITTSGVAVWSPDHTETTVPVSVYVFALAEGSGSITLIATETGWEFFGTGSGQVLHKEGSATAEGFMPADMTPSPELLADATGVSETAQSLDDATGPLQPGDQPPAVDTGDIMGELAAILLAVFLVILIELILGVVLL